MKARVFLSSWLSPLRAVMTLLAVLTVYLQLPAVIKAQDLLPPRQGWTAQGAGSLLDSSAAPGASLLSLDRGPDWWIYHARPYDVAGLSYSGAALAVRYHQVSGAVEWRQLAGDGLIHRSIHVVMAAVFRRSGSMPRSPGSPQPEKTLLAAGITFMGINGSGAGNLRWTRLRLGMAHAFRSAWSVAAEIRGPIGGAYKRGRTHFVCAIAWNGDPCSLRIGALKQSRSPLEPSIVISWRYGGMRLSAGGWGSPVAPAAGIDLTIAGIIWGIEGRWIAGPGLYLLWSIRAPAGGA